VHTKCALPLHMPAPSAPTPRHTHSRCTLRVAHGRSACLATATSRKLCSTTSCGRRPKARLSTLPTSSATLYAYARWLCCRRGALTTLS
jgi:hypothetical protein